MPLPIGPSATAAGRVLNPIVAWDSNATISSNAICARTPDIGCTKYSIMPLVCGWLGSKRTNSPSQTTSIPAFSWRWITVRVASSMASAVGWACSHSGQG